jgi:hypothetical protein
LVYQWHIDPSDQQAVPVGKTLRWTFKNAKDYVVRLTVTDDEGLQDTDVFIVKVREDEKPEARSDLVLPEVSTKVEGEKPVAGSDLVLPELSIRVFSRTGVSAQHPKAEITVPNGYKIIGGGAKVNWSGAGNLLTSSYPVSKNKWAATSKDHDHYSPATITVYAVAIQDPANEWEVRVFEETSLPAAHPRSAAFVPDDYLMTGGGARVHWKGEGNLLTASFPRDKRTWEARAKDHGHSSHAELTAYAIGIRPRNGAPLPEGHIFTSTGAVAAHPAHQVRIDDGYMLAGGGVLDNWGGHGNILTATYPINDQAWGGKGKDHSESDPAALTVYAIGIKK